MKIYITGCARSGTTLLKRMFFSFKDVEVIIPEINILDFAQRKHNENTLIGKRSINTIFSNILEDEDIERQLNIIKNNDIKILNIVRNGIDVMGSGKVSPERWIHSIRQFNKYKEVVDICVYYEDLIKSPDNIQHTISNYFNLIPIYKFSDYPDFLPTNIEFRGGDYKPRKISNDRIGKKYDWKSRINNESIYYDFIKCIDSIGYKKEIIL